MMFKLFLIFLLFCLFSQSKSDDTPPDCPGPNKYPTNNCYQYYECVQNLWWYTPVLKNCSSGLGFNPITETCSKTDCKSPSASTLSFPTCTGPAKYQGPTCNQYYECIKTLWWWDSKLQTCPDGYGFDALDQDCTDKEVNCAPQPSPTCRGIGKFAGPKCNQYYDCIMKWWWYKPILMTCPSGQSFNETGAYCQCSSSCI